MARNNQDFPQFSNDEENKKPSFFDKYADSSLKSDNEGQKESENKSAVATLEKDAEEQTLVQKDKPKTKQESLVNDPTNYMSEEAFMPETKKTSKPLSSRQLQAEIGAVLNAGVEQRQNVEETHKRQTYYINRELIEIFNLISNTKRRGYKHYVINEALRMALIQILKQSGMTDQSPVMKTLYNLAPENQ